MRPATRFRVIVLGGAVLVLGAWLASRGPADIERSDVHASGRGGFVEPTYVKAVSCKDDWSIDIRYPTDAASAEAEVVYAERCAPCHGVTGKGDGAAAATLDPKPHDYTSAAWQASVTDSHIEMIIVEGVERVGGSPLMPRNPDLATMPGVVDALRLKIRAFATPS